MDVAQGCAARLPSSETQMLTCYARPCLQIGFSAFRKIEMRVGTPSIPWGACCTPGQEVTGECLCLSLLGLLLQNTID